ncbi:MAG: hypothetical protein V3W18_03255 [candidate division Zixibacteria bacterium]
MNKPSAIPSSLGFYLILLFSFSVSVFPAISYYLAAGAFGVWLFQILIFRQTGFISSPLFYPIAGLTVFSVIVWSLSSLYSYDNPVICVGLYSLFYFVIYSFVSSHEKRKMLIWTFLGGIILSVGIEILSNLESSAGVFPGSLILEEHLPTLLIMGFCLIVAMFAMASGIREKLFYGLISLPLVAGVLISGYTITLITMIVLLAAGLIKEKSILIAAALIAIVVSTGLFGAKGEIITLFDRDNLTELVVRPIDDIGRNVEHISNSGFFGSPGNDQTGESAPQERSFFISLIRHAGPPSLLLFLWVIFELARRDLTKIRKLSEQEEKAYHLATLIFMAIIIVANIYGSYFSCSPAILGLWMFLGMAEI